MKKLYLIIIIAVLGVSLVSATHMHVQALGGNQPKLTWAEHNYVPNEGLYLHFSKTIGGYDFDTRNDPLCTTESMNCKFEIKVKMYSKNIERYSVKTSNDNGVVFFPSDHVESVGNNGGKLYFTITSAVLTFDEINRDTETVQTEITFRNTDWYIHNEFMR